MSIGTVPRANSGLAMTPQKAFDSSSRRPHTKYPLFAAPSSGGMSHRQDGPSVRQKLQIALLLFSRRLTQLARKVRLPLAMLMAVWTLHFGGLSPTMPAHAAAAAAAKTTPPISRPARKAKPTKKAANTEKSTATTTSMDRHKRNAVVAAGFGASLYSVKTRRKRGQNTEGDEDDAKKEKEEPALEIVQKLTLEDLEDKESTVEVTITDKETEDTAVISTTAKSPSTSVEVVSKKEVDDDNPIVQFLDAVGANPEVVFGFLGSSASFMVSENLFVSGLAFAWIFSLFKESETPDVTDADIDDIDEDQDEEETAEIEEGEVLPVVIEGKNKDDETVGIEEYRSEEIKAEESSSDAEESSHMVPAEEINEEIIAQKIEEEIEVVVAEATTEPVNKDGSTSFADDKKSEEAAASTPVQEVIEEVVAKENTEPEEAAASPIQKIIEEVVAEENTEPVVQEKIEPVVAEENTKPEEAAASPIQEVIEEVVTEENTEPMVQDKIEPVVAEETTEPSVQEKIEQVVAEEINEPIVHSINAAVEEVTGDDSQENSSASSQKMSIGDMAYKVVMDLGLIEWDRNKREKN
ncbi:MAG: hypothetical protein SGBAC_009946 [Bacillariaceae sp.]